MKRGKNTKLTIGALRGAMTSSTVAGARAGDWARVPVATLGMGSFFGASAAGFGASAAGFGASAAGFGASAAGLASATTVRSLPLDQDANCPPPFTATRISLSLCDTV